MKGGDVYRKKRMTKGELVRLFKEKGGIMSPELGVEVVEGGDDVELNVPYEIVNVEDVTTDVSFYKGVRVELVSAQAEMGAVMLWKRGKVGTQSKLGAFITLLGSNTDNWLYKWVVFQAWEKNRRHVLAASAPVSKVTEAATAKGAAKAIKEG